MVAKKRDKKRLGKIRGFSLQFLPFTELNHLNSDERIRKVLDIVLGNNILLLQGKLRPEEETRLIGDTMAMIGHVKNFRGIELAVISNSSELGFFERMRTGIANALSGGDLGAVTIIGPATIVKEIAEWGKWEKVQFTLNEDAIHSLKTPSDFHEGGYYGERTYASGRIDIHCRKS
jgi:hypothetical protein